MTVGIFGGAFDPPHVGHVELARRGSECFDIDRLLVRVVEEPGHKDVSTAPQVRLILAELAFAPLDEAEVALDPFSRTVDSLEALAVDDAVFLVGADEFADFLDWKEPTRVLELAQLGRPDRVSFFEIDPLPVSSSDIRARVGAGEPIGGLVPPPVEAEIALLELYRRVDRPGAGGMLRDDPIEGTTPT